MPTDPIETLEYESMVFGRSLSAMPGRTRRTGGVLDQSAYVLLSVLHVGGPQSIGELSALTGLDASTLNRQTAALLREGYAERIADPDGGLARKFLVSALGGQVLGDERRASHAALETILVDWSTADRQLLADLLGRLNRAVEDRYLRRWPRPSAID